MTKSINIVGNKREPDFSQSFVHFAVVPSPNSATFVFLTNRPCQPNIDIFPLASSNIDQDMQHQKVIAGNALANLATPAGNQHVFRVPRRWVPGKPADSPQLKMGQRFRFRVIAPPDNVAISHGFRENVIITGEFSTGFRHGSVVVNDLNVFRAGDPHHFGLVVGAYRDIDGLRLDQRQDTFTTSEDINFDNSNGVFRDPFKGRPLSVNQSSDKLRFYSMGWGPNRNPLSTGPFRPTDFFDAPSVWPDTPDHGEDDNGPWATAVGFVDLPDWSLPGVDGTTFQGATQNAAAFASNPATIIQSNLATSLDCGNFGIHYQINLTIGVSVVPPTALPTIDGQLKGKTRFSNLSEEAAASKP